MSTPTRQPRFTLGERVRVTSNDFADTSRMGTITALLGTRGYSVTFDNLAARMYCGENELERASAVDLLAELLSA